MNMLIGVRITDIAQVNEVIDFSTAVAFKPSSLTELTEYLDEINNRLTPVIVITEYFLSDGLYVNTNPQPLRDAILDSKHIGRIVFMFDEPLWRARRNGQDPDDVINIMRQIKANFYGVEFAHIEAYAELYKQYIENHGKLTLFLDADHIGFDCYGKFCSCGGDGIPEIPQLTYLQEIYNAIQQSCSNAKIFLVPAAFSNKHFFDSDDDVIQQFNNYVSLIDGNIYGNSKIISGIGAFIWGDMTENGVLFEGARNNPAIKNVVVESLGRIGKINTLCNQG